jgi:hypothetical protein
MEKKVKKLALSKETLRSLNEGTLGKAVGGATIVDTACPSCWDTCGRTCPC